MIALFCLFLALFFSPFKSKSRLEAENVALRHQLIILRRKVRGRIRLTHGDRLFFVQLYRWFPAVLTVITIARPEPLMRWRRAGFRRYWRWKSRSLGGRPQIDADLRALIRRMRVDNPLWERRASMASCSSSALRSLSPASRSIWSSDAAHPPLGGAPSCVTMHPTSPPWICSLPRPLLSTCSMSLSSFDQSGDNLSGSTSHHIRPRNGLHARSQRHSPGIRPRAT